MDVTPATAPPQLRLVGLSYSPWTEKARWALDHHRLPYKYQEYLPLLGEPVLRLATRELRGKVTVPVLFEGRVATMDSYDIARQAERLGAARPAMARRPPLFPEGQVAEIRRWNERSETILAAGRALSVEAVAASPAGRRESAERLVPGPLAVLGGPLASLGIAFLRSKYQLRAATAEAEMREALEELEKGLAGGRQHLLDGFSYADVTMAVALQFVKPVGDEYIRLGPAQRECFTVAGLAERFAGLCEWRDEVYRRFRR